MPKEIPLQIPGPIQEIKEWVILGLDPSLSRTGYSLMRVQPAEVKGTTASWVGAGSIKPDPIESGLSPQATIWIRCKLIALYLRKIFETQITKWQDEGVDTKKVGLIIALEAPPPQNDYLASIHRAIHMVLFQNSFLSDNFGQIRILYINASTLRSLMKLTQRGPKNKAENIARAYDFISKETYPELDPDSCDAVLVAMVARHVTSVVMGFPDEVPQNFLNSLCNATQETKGKGVRTRIVTKGIFHRNEYWYMYQRQSYDVAVKDATIPKKTLSRVEFVV
jgi:hypothetical protein